MTYLIYGGAYFSIQDIQQIIIIQRLYCLCYCFFLALDSCVLGRFCDTPGGRDNTFTAAMYFCIAMDRDMPMTLYQASYLRQPSKSPKYSKSYINRDFEKKNKRRRFWLVCAYLTEWVIRGWIRNGDNIQNALACVASSPFFVDRLTFLKKYLYYYKCIYNMYIIYISDIVQMPSLSPSTVTETTIINCTCA